jgi:hypothetical protein
MRLPRIACLLLIAVSTAVPASAAMVNISPSKDNTLIQQTDPALQRSNGQGDLFAGRTGQDGQGPATISIRRGLVYFDIAAAVPTGATITSATLTVQELTGLNGDRTTTLHRVLQSWGEGASLQNGGQGALAEQGDATWRYTFFDKDSPTSSPAWTTPGGDFDPAISATTIVSDDLGGNKLFAWSSAGMVADLQQWLDSPAMNFGWLIRGDESAGQTAKRLGGRSSAFPPSLMITYIAVPEPGTMSLVVIGLMGRLVRRRG